MGTHDFKYGKWAESKWQWILKQSQKLRKPQAQLAYCTPLKIWRNWRVFSVRKKTIPVDNCLTSLDTKEETLKFIQDSKEIMTDANFNLGL